jgi:hypothetical protein
MPFAQSEAPAVSFYNPPAPTTHATASLSHEIKSEETTDLTHESFQAPLENVPSLQESLEPPPLINSSGFLPQSTSSQEIVIKKPLRSSYIRQAQWRKNEIATTSSHTTTTTSSRFQPFKKIVNIKTQIIQKTLQENVVKPADKAAYQAHLQSIAFVKELYGKKISQKFYDQCKSVRQWSYLTEDIKPGTILILCTWDRKGKLLSYKQLESSGNKQIDTFLKEFFTMIKFPAIPHELPDPFTQTCRVHLQRTVKGLTDFYLTPLDY